MTRQGERWKEDEQFKKNLSFTPTMKPARYVTLKYQKTKKKKKYKKHQYVRRVAKGYERT